VATDKERGTRIKHARQLRFWRQIDLARALRVNVKTVGNWERGETIPRNRIPVIEATLGIKLTEEPPNGVPWYDADDPVESALAEDPRLPEPVRRRFVADLRAQRMQHVPRAHEPPAG
jgi:transcriptional regulator with XRE-family HTH domain